MDPSAYLSMVHHNRAVYELVRGSSEKENPPRDCTDWLCTLLFYMACISVKCYAAANGKAIQDHYDLRKWMNNDPKLYSIGRSYRKLEEHSRDARYEGMHYSPVAMAKNYQWFWDVHIEVIRLLKADKMPQAAPIPAFKP